LQSSDVLDLSVSLERVVSMVRRLMPNQAMSLTAVSVLRSLEMYGPTRLTELASAQGVTQPAMTQLVTRLERDGYVRRQGSDADARVVLVTLTGHGEQFLHERREARARRLDELLAGLPADDRARILAAIPALTLLASLGQEVVDTRPTETMSLKTKATPR
ncbi:MAG TPA: MarR family transcriptional regulator, partial [Micromonosporaceae bacterium]